MSRDCHQFSRYVHCWYSFPGWVDLFLSKMKCRNLAKNCKKFKHSISTWFPKTFERKSPLIIYRSLGKYLKYRRGKVSHIFDNKRKRMRKGNSNQEDHHLDWFSLINVIEILFSSSSFENIGREQGQTVIERSTNCRSWYIVRFFPWWRKPNPFISSWLFRFVCHSSSQWTNRSILSSSIVFLSIGILVFFLWKESYDSTCS